MDTGPTTTTDLLRIVVRSATRRGVDAAELLSAAGLTTDALKRDGDRVPCKLERVVWAEATRLTRSAALGLHAAESLEPGDLGVLDYLTRSRSTLGEAFVSLGRYHRLVHDLLQLEIATRHGVAHIQHLTIGYPVDLSPPFVDFALAALVVVGRQMTRLDLKPLEVSFQHPRLARLAEYHRVFGCRVHFGAPRNELRLDATWLSRPVVRADTRLSAVLERYAGELLARLPAGTSLRERVQCCLTDELRGGHPSAEQIARRLRVSTRQLQRRLKREGTSFRSIRQSLRRCLAPSYLADQHLSLSEVAFMLGFADPGSFHRAFKRWTGKTPGAYRRS